MHINEWMDGWMDGWIVVINFVVMSCVLNSFVHSFVHSCILLNSKYIRYVNYRYVSFVLFFLIYPPFSRMYVLYVAPRVPPPGHVLHTYGLNLIPPLAQMTLPVHQADSTEHSIATTPAISCV